MPIREENVNPHITAIKSFIADDQHRKIFSTLFSRDYTTGYQSHEVETKLSLFFNDPKIKEIMADSSILYLCSLFNSSNEHVISFLSRLKSLFDSDPEFKEFLRDLHSLFIIKRIKKEKEPHYAYATGRIIDFIATSIKSPLTELFQHSSVIKLLSYDYRSNDFEKCVDHFDKQMNAYIQFLQKPVQLQSEMPSTLISLVQDQLAVPEIEFIFVDKLSFKNWDITYGIDFNASPEYSRSFFSPYQLPDPEELRIYVTKEGKEIEKSPFYETKEDQEIARNLLKKGKEAMKK